PNAKLVTANGDSVFITVNTNGVFVNGIQTLANDVQASNGYIDAMSAPLFPPRGTILQTLQADTSFSYLVAALSRASLGTTDMNGMLSSGGPYTIFAPVNYAFRTAGFATVDQINNSNSDSLANILLYNILPGRTFTSDLSTGAVRTTLNDSTILFTSSGATRQIQGSMNTIPANVVAANIMARNGVMYIIDQVLLPKQQ
ncbi:MAG TPA: fasciclin domain-containing protein, partial [Puia sp.]|nr:fasciclin domain-containing protein [Puia sp.]